MNKTLAIAALAATAGLSQAAIITQWNFNSNPADASTATGNTAPALGTGTISVFGGATQNFASGNSSSDPVTVDDSGYNTTAYQANPTTGPVSPVELRGVSVAVSTALYQDIIINFDWRTSNTASDLLRVDYSIDGGVNWTLGPVFDSGGGDTWNNGLAVDLSSDASADNNANLVVRFVPVVDSATGRYRAANPTSSYAGTGTFRYDMITINGTLIPSPGALALAGVGGLLCARRRRK
jgi:hypothetical protein